MAAHQAGDLEESTERLQAALPLAEGFGPTDPRLGETLLALGTTHYASGDYRAAVSPLQRAVAVIAASAEADSTKLATTLNALGLVYGRQGQAEEARPLYGWALAIYERALGTDHPRVANAVENLAGLELASGRYVEAEAQFAPGLGDQGTVPWPREPGTAADPRELCLGPDLSRSHDRRGGAERPRRGNPRTAGRLAVTTTAP